MRRQHRIFGFLALLLSSALLASACGGDDDQGFAPNDDTVEEDSDPGEGDGTEGHKRGNILEGDWQATPGQADAVETTLSGKGYECSRHADESLDVRMCAKGVDAEDEFGPIHTMGRLRFMADGEGTVVLAAIDGDTATFPPDEWEDLKREMVEALLPPADAAVLLADGTRLSWGTAESDPSNSENLFLRIDGFTPPTPYLPEGKPFRTTAEAALPALQSAGLDCTFENQPSDGTEPSPGETVDTGGTPQLICLDPSFTSENEDGSIEGATAELILVDNGNGIAQLSVEGRHGSVPDDRRAVEQLLAKVVTAIDEDPLPEVGSWLESHLDGPSSSAYIGSWQAVLHVAEGSMFGDSVTLVLTPELPDFGAPSSQSADDGP